MTALISAPISALYLPPLLAGVIRIQLDIAAGCRAIARPVSPIRLDRRQRLSVVCRQSDRLSERFELDMDSALSRVARFAEAHEIFLDHCPAFAFRHDMAAMIRLARPAGDAACKGGHDVGADGGGYAGLGGHDSGSFRCR